jgi:hemerythrin superfamily protein
MVGEFRWVHGLIRRELGALRDLADRVLDGQPAEDVRAEIQELSANSPVWALRIHCLHYCRFVHGHHSYEDAAFFPRLREADPALNPVVDRLEAEHRVVAEHLDAIEHLAANLNHADGDRPSLATALTELADHLLAHLDFEEESIFPALRAMADFRR